MAIAYVHLSLKQFLKQSFSIARQAKLSSFSYGKTSLIEAISAIKAARAKSAIMLVAVSVPTLLYLAN